MSTEIRNDKAGWSREVEKLDDKTKYVLDSRFSDDGSLEYHEYNVYDGGTHTHIHGEITKDGEQKYSGGHGEEKKTWRW